MIDEEWKKDPLDGRRSSASHSSGGASGARPSKSRLAMFGKLYHGVSSLALKGLRVSCKISAGRLCSVRGAGAPGSEVSGARKRRKGELDGGGRSVYLLSWLRGLMQRPPTFAMRHCQKIAPPFE
jgi:hypothetical protein